MQSAVLLIDPKFAENVGGAIRACAAFETPVLRWTGTRVLDSKTVARRARLRAHAPEVDAAVDSASDEQAFEHLTRHGLVPVAVELCEGATELGQFEHPENALYVFGPEDSSLSNALMDRCEHRVRIPVARCLNLAATVNVVLYDRQTKLVGRQIA
jgi:tRNA(Leu) C34 or U34 (ribose-2'-O)-methylase TrmL